jgi:hypothetical protein
MAAWLLPGLPDHQVGLFLRAHHTIADGVAGLVAFGALLDLDADTLVSTVSRAQRPPARDGGRTRRDRAAETAAAAIELLQDRGGDGAIQIQS